MTAKLMMLQSPVSASLFLFVYLFFCFFSWKNFHEIDSNKDGFVSPEEIYDIKYDELERLLGCLEEDEEQDEIEDNLDETKDRDTQPEETSEHSTDEKTDNTNHNDHVEL